MGAVDTNILVRLVVMDDASQTARVKALLLTAIETGDRLHVSAVAVVELVWVLASHYRFTRAAIAGELTKLLAAPYFEFQSRMVIEGAAERFAAGKADLADYIIAEQAKSVGATPLDSFDARLVREGLAVAP